MVRERVDWFCGIGCMRLCYSALACVSLGHFMIRFSRFLFISTYPSKMSNDFFIVIIEILPFTRFLNNGKIQANFEQLDFNA